MMTTKISSSRATEDTAELIKFYESRIKELEESIQLKDLGIKEQEHVIKHMRREKYIFIDVLTDINKLTYDVNVEKALFNISTLSDKTLKSV